MDTTTIYEPERPHKCYPYPAARESRPGTIQRCDMCGLFWESRPDRWRRVRWWHFTSRRRIKQLTRVPVPQIQQEIP